MVIGDRRSEYQSKNQRLNTIGLGTNDLLNSPLEVILSGDYSSTELRQIATARRNSFWIFPKSWAYNHIGRNSN